MSKHTAAPWDYAHELITVERVPGHPVFTTADAYYPVAHVFDIEPAHEANARLIAAAPDLLAACEAILDTRPYLTGPAASQLRAAIARAGGESPP